MAADTPDSPVKFAIGDQEYELPDPLSLTMDEWAVCWDYGQFVLEDFAPLEDKEEEAARVRRLKNPAMMQSLFHIGYQRANPKAEPKEIRAMIGGSKMLGLLESMAGDETDGEPENPTPAPKPETSSSRKSGASNASSSASSPKSSDEPEPVLAPTGTSA